MIGLFLIAVLFWTCFGFPLSAALRIDEMLGWEVLFAICILVTLIHIKELLMARKMRRQAWRRTWNPITSTQAPRYNRQIRRARAAELRMFR